MSLCLSKGLLRPQTEHPHPLTVNHQVGTGSATGVASFDQVSLHLLFQALLAKQLQLKIRICNAVGTKCIDLPINCSDLSDIFSN